MPGRGSLTMNTADWQDLEQELAAWRRLGRTVTFWWRDDDAAAFTPAFARLLALRRAAEVPLALAVIPAHTTRLMARRVAAERCVSVLQHGYAHRNHAAPGDKKSELGGCHPRRLAARELVRGRERLNALFPAHARPVLVPPWNRIDPDLVPTLPALGFRGLSVKGPRASGTPVPGLFQANVHIDVVDWRGGRRFVGERRALGQVLAHLAARRTRHADPLEPSGLMTHHQTHDADCWAFVARLLERTRAHPHVCWLNGDELFETATACHTPVATAPVRAFNPS